MRIKISEVRIQYLWLLGFFFVFRTKHLCFLLLLIFIFSIYFLPIFFAPYIFVETQLVSVPFSFNSFHTRSGGGVVDNTLDYQSRDRLGIARSILHFSDLSDETLNRGPVPSPYDLIVGATLDPSSLTHSLFSYSEYCPSAVISGFCFLLYVSSSSKC